MVELSNPTVILTDTGELQLTNISRHCLLHAVEVLRPDVSLSIVLPKSGSHKIEGFCHELQETILVKLSKKKAVPLIPEDPLMPSIEIHRFCEGATGSLDFMLIAEKNFLSSSKGNIDLDAFHRCCWKYYEMERKSEISFPRWFSRECTYRLWLIYNCVLEPDLCTNLSLRTTNEVMKRMVEYCGYTWNPSYEYSTKNDITFPEYLSAITTYFEQFRLETSLTCEVIGDMVDEIVHGVLKTGRLTKKGHKRKNWKTRWFVLQRTVLRYYESRENMSLKGQLVLNGNTEVKSLPDKTKRKFCFHVTCGHTGTLFEIAADDQRMKHEWILAIKKAIALARVLDGSSKASDFVESLQGFYLLKYGTSQPALARQDSTVRKMKFHATMKDQRKRLSGRDAKATTVPVKGFESSGETDDQEQYVPMGPLKDGNITSDDSDSDDENRYVSMKPLSQEELLENSNSIEVSQSLPGQSTLEGKFFAHHHQATRTVSEPAKTRTSNEKISTQLEPTDEGDEEERPYDPVTFEKKNSKEDLKILSRKTSDQESSLLSASDDGKEGSYIQLFHQGPNQPSPSTKGELEKSFSYDQPGSWLGTARDADVVKVKYSTVKQPPPTSNDKEGSGEYENNDSSAEPNLYLTLVHSGPTSPTSSASETMSPTRDRPPAVPTHKKSSSPAMSPTITLSPKHKERHSMYDLPPAPPPRSRGSSPNLCRAPPPLPKRSGDSPPTRQYHNIIPGKPSPALRRSTMAPAQTQRPIKEEVAFKRGSSCDNNYDEMDINRNSLSPPPIPPR